MRSELSPAIFSLHERIRRGYEDSSIGATTVQRVFFDFAVDGLSLYDSLAAARRDLVSLLWKNPVTPDTNQNAVRRLLTIEEADAPSGAVAVYVCPECGDPGCGAITVRISATKEEFIWEDFGYENNYDGERTLLPVIGPFRFTRAQYEAALKPFAQS
jgi:hypothetical protein